jgi:sensor histidine kinase YesM
MEAHVPNLLLQPLVENAIQHGIEHEARPGEITISAARAGNELILTISDNGAGLEAGWKPGVGLSNTRARLEQLYQTRARLELTAGPVNGVITRVTLPYRV